METKREELVDKLRDILEKNVDAQKGYENAAENAAHHDLKEYFTKKSGQRREFKKELEREITAGYGTLIEDGSTAGAIHRTWMDIKTFFMGNSDEAMIEECRRGDKAAIDDYEAILKEEGLPMGISTLIRDQLVKIRTNLNKIKSLEDSH